MPNPTSTAVLRITRTFPASRDRVFEAFTEPDLLKQWWGPAGFSLPQATVDLRVGGRYRFGMQPPQGDVMYLVGTFREIRRPERLVYTWAWESAPETETVVTIEFRQAEGDTEVVVTQEPFPSDEVRQQHVFGWEGGLDRLTEVFRRENMAKPKLEYQAYIRTTPEKLWDAITNPEQTRQYFYGLAVRSDWKPGSTVTHLLPDGKSQMEGKVVAVEPRRKLVHTFATTGVNDAPTRVTYEIEPMGSVVLLTLTHDDFDGETQTYQSVARGWNPVVSGLKTLLETGQPLEMPMPSGAATA